jgi:hypothetical protein
METQQPTEDVSELQALIDRQRRVLDELEGRLVESPTSETAEVVRRTLNARPARMALARVRRAARAASAAPVVHVAVPRGDDPLSREARQIAEARMYTWQRADEAIEAIAQGDYAVARRALEDLLATEQAIQILLEDLTVPQPSWRELQDELGRSSDMIVTALQQQLESIERPGAMAAVRTGQSQWVRAWRTYLMVTGLNRQG